MYATCRQPKPIFFTVGGSLKRSMPVDFLAFSGAILKPYQHSSSRVEGPKTSDSACHWLQIAPITEVNCGVNITFRVVKLQYLIM